MVLSGYSFLLRFLPVFLIIYYIVPPKFRKAVLTVFSLYFYGHGEGLYIFVLIISCIINYFFLCCLNDNKPKPVFKGIFNPVHVIGLSLFFNVILLAAFKYFNILPHQPLGISFFTFRTMGCLIDVYRKDAAPCDKFIDFAAYICAFPLISMGPITSYKRTAFQLSAIKLKSENIDEGLKLLVLGLSAKVLLADRIGTLYWDVRTMGLASASTALAWLCALSYSFQLYFDFAGYSLMAQGLLHMMGVSIPDNFNLPYTSKSVTEFWRRWHISLGTWFKEYVYIPLGGSRKGKAKTYRNIALIWFLTALWHGFGINFMLWGLLLFLLMFIEKVFSLKYLEKIPVIGHIYMLFIIPLSWALFSVTDSPELLNYMGRLLPFITLINKEAFSHLDYVSSKDIISYVKDYYYLFICCILFSLPFFKNLYTKYKKSPGILFLLLILTAMCLYRIGISSSNPFMYFDF